MQLDFSGKSTAGCDCTVAPALTELLLGIILQLNQSFLHFVDTEASFANNLLMQINRGDAVNLSNTSTSL